MGPRVRRWRWPVATAAAVLVAGAVLVPRLQADDPAPTSTRGTDCVPTTELTLDAAGEEASAEATWVRFCPLAAEGATQRVRHPQGVVTGELAASVATTLWQTQLERPTCLPGDAPTTRPTGLYRIEVGLAGGEVAALEGDTGCSERDRALFSQLETTLLMQTAATLEPAPDLRPVRCPGRLSVEDTNRDGATADQLVDTAELTWQSTVPVLPAPAAAADVCAYTGRGPGRTLVDRWRVDAAGAETIRSATRDVHIGAVADCDVDPRRTSYVVVLTDASGTARSLALDATECATLRAAIGTPPVATHLGLATQRLVRAVERSRP